MPDSGRDLNGGVLRGHKSGSARSYCLLLCRHAPPAWASRFGAGAGGGASLHRLAACAALLDPAQPRDVL